MRHPISHGVAVLVLASHLLHWTFSDHHAPEIHPRSARTDVETVEMIDVAADRGGFVFPSLQKNGE